MLAMAVKTVNKNYVGRKCGVLSLTRKGKCPTCGAIIERKRTDIFFPFCGYTCKRVVQRKEEEKEKRKIAKQMMKYEMRLAGVAEKTQQEEERKKKEAYIEQVRNRLEKCQSEYNKYYKSAASLPKGSRQKWREKEKAQKWYEKLIEAQRVMNEATKEEHE